MARVLSLALAALVALIALSCPLNAASVKVLRIQLVLVSAKQGSVIPYEMADVVASHIKAKVPELKMNKILRGEDRIILDFQTATNKASAVKEAIGTIATTRAGAFVKVEVYKPVIEKLKSDATEVQEKTDKTAKPPTSANDEARVINFRIKTNSQGQFSIVVRNIEMGVLLEALCDSSNFQYLCPQSIWKQRITLNADEISMENYT